MILAACLAFIGIALFFGPSDVKDSSTLKEEYGYSEIDIIGNKATVVTSAGGGKAGLMCLNIRML